MRAFLVAIVMTIATQATSQNFEPIRDLSTDVARPYVSVRCGGLYHAIMERTGAERMGSDAWKASDEARNAMLLMGLLAKTEEQPNRPAEEFIPSLQKETLNIADIYLARMDHNYSLTGHAYGTDSLMKSDIEDCGLIVQTIIPQLRDMK